MFYTNTDDPYKIVHMDSSFPGLVSLPADVFPEFIPGWRTYGEQLGEPGNGLACSEANNSSKEIS